MKKIISWFLLFALLASFLCVTALATDAAAVAGIYGVELVEGVTDVTITPEGTAITVTVDGQEVSGYFSGAEKLTVTYSDAVSGAQYLLLVMNRNTPTPQAADIVYIDQKAADSSGVSFTAFPSSLNKGTYYIYLSSDAADGLGKDGLTLIGSFKNYVPYKLGDVNDDSKVNSTDALWILQAAAEKRNLTPTQTLAADVKIDGKVNATDALWVLQAAAEKRTLGGN